MEKVKSAELRRVKISFALYVAGFMFVFSSHNAVFNLQSSINVVDGLGTTGQSVFQASTVVSALLLSPLLRKLGIRRGLIASDCFYVFYIAVNFYPDFYTIIPGSLFGGLAKTLFWVNASTLNVHFAKELTKQGRLGFPTYLSQVGGYYFGCYLSCQVFGNMIPFAVFQIDKSQSVTNFSLNATWTGRSNLTIPTVTTTTDLRTYYSVSDHCGSNDCQDQAVIGRSTNYQPKSKNTTYIALGVLVFLNVLGLVVHYLFLPDAPLSDYESDTPKRTNSSPPSHPNNNIPIKKRSLRDFVWQDLKGNFRQFFKLDQLILTGLLLHLGLTGDFTYGEVTRSYVSCVFGVTQVGVAMSLYGALALVGAIACGRTAGKWGRILPGVCFVILNISSYLVALLWVPTENSSIGFVYGLMCLLGAADGLLTTLNTIMVAVVFPDCLKYGYTAWITVVTIGSLWQFAWSTFVCVATTIYVMFGSLALCVVSFGVSEYRVRLKEKLLIEEERNSKITTVDDIVVQ